MYFILSNAEEQFYLCTLLTIIKDMLASLIIKV